PDVLFQRLSVIGPIGPQFGIGRHGLKGHGATLQKLPGWSGVCNFFAAAQDEDGGGSCRLDRTKETWLFASRRRAPELYEISPLPMRGRREDRMLVAPVECERKITTGSTGATRPSLRDWFTAYTRSPRRAGLSSHRPPGALSVSAAGPTSR